MNNYCLLIGRIANDFDINKTKDGKSVTNITLAVTKPFKNPETNLYDVDFIKATLWEHIAQNTKEYCKKGDMVAIKARLTTKTEVLEGGINTTQIELVAERVMFLSSTTKQQEKELT